METEQKKELTFVKNERPGNVFGHNEVLHDGQSNWYISYSPKPTNLDLAEGEGFVKVLMGLQAHEETALVVYNDDEESLLGRDFYILNGDWREQYQKAANEGGLDACMQVFNANKEEHKSWFSAE